MRRDLYQRFVQVAVVGDQTFELHVAVIESDCAAAIGARGTKDQPPAKPSRARSLDGVISASS
jgi:hypothetical protein